MNVAFRDFMQQVEPIKLKEPLAKTLGAFTSDEAVLEYSFIAAVKMADKAMRMKELLEKVIWEAANDQEQREFQDLWIERVKLMIVERKDLDSWLKIEQRSN